MPHKAEFSGWESLTIEDLLVAYRKAKADCFFENTFPTAIKFAEYEQDLLANLKGLLKLLQKADGFAKNNELLGDFRLLPKKLSTERKSDSGDNGHVHFSKPDRAVESLFKNYNVVPEFRIVGDFPVNTHIISALWINMIGHKFDAKFDESCYGARLKRIRNDELFVEDNEKPFHISSIGSFVPYFQPYQKWRNDGLKTIRDELEKEHDIIAVSLDLKSYYHFIDPLITSAPALVEALDLKLSDEEKSFTDQLSRFLNAWGDGATKFGKSVGGKKAKISGGLVIGLTCSRVISNALLHKWDRLVLKSSRLFTMAVTLMICSWCCAILEKYQTAKTLCFYCKSEWVKSVFHKVPKPVMYGKLTKAMKYKVTPKYRFNQTSKSYLYYKVVLA